MIHDPKNDTAMELKLVVLSKPSGQMIVTCEASVEANDPASLLLAAEQMVRDLRAEMARKIRSLSGQAPIVANRGGVS